MKNDKTITIIPQACASRTNPESAPCGEAAEAVNVRECEQGLVAVGMPKQVARLAASERLLTIAGGHFISANESAINVDGTPVAPLNGATAVEAHASGQIVTVITSDGPIHLAKTSEGFSQLCISDAIPLINICETETAAMNVPMSSYTFSQPLSAWQSPLSNEDATALAKREKQAHDTLAATCSAQGRYTGLMLVRYGVRLWDDSYLWLSAPVMLGCDNATGNYRRTVEATTSGGHYTGINDSTLSANAYRIGITVISGIANNWHGIVKAVDILATSEAMPFSTAALDYRFVRGGSLQLGPAPRNTDSISARLIKADWHLVASTCQLSELGNHNFVAHNTPSSSQIHFPGIVSRAVSSSLQTSTMLTAAECDEIVSATSQFHIPRCATVASGRLVAAGGKTSNRMPWNPLPLFTGNVASGSCTLATTLTLATPQGFAEVVRTDSLNFIPTEFNPLIAVPHQRAVNATFTLTLPDGTASSCSMQLASIPETNLAMAITIEKHKFTSTGAAAPCAAPYLEDSEGLVSVHRSGNPFTLASSRIDTGLSTIAVAAAKRPLYSGSLGRYPLYVFASEGIFALPGTLSDGFGEPRAIAQAVIGAQAQPCAGNGSIWFVDTGKRLMRLTGTKLSTILTGIAATSLAWDSMHTELAVATGDKTAMLAVQPSGRVASRSISASMVGADSAGNAYAVNPTGAVLSLGEESASPIAVTYRSQPITVSATAMGGKLSHITWNLCGDVASLRLKVTAHRGISCHGFLVSAITVNGSVGSPIALPIISQPLRTFRVGISGTVTPGTLVLPITTNVTKMLTAN